MIYNIQHSFRYEIIIPVAALHNNIDFFMDNDEKIVKTSDGFICSVLNWSYIHICDLEKDVKRLYNIDIWSFIQKWYSAIPYMESMYFLKIFLEKKEVYEK